ncbi:hypothetical protein [Pseudobacteroides cellulosolvens]|uniref:Uncharacterized protein n=1 Tax=Pseudobacteroides cellulosolvens ATCC 35603 = DSM 2933 TaxID=398512 RepID=A0A0L6JLR7_9FIRM|nr:hypothetical protein [Pseudobacteroides cellulosolvens]KNY26342.1 hypothetical protein Bccel_1604 [Pseudobacteroides cellulosolvens ATCC 35603 = DSM 2933]
MRIKLKYCRYCLNYVIKHETWHKHINKIRLENIEKIKEIKEDGLSELLEEYKLRLESDYMKIFLPIITFITNIMFSIMFSAAAVYWGFKNSLINSYWSKTFDKPDFNKPEFKSELIGISQNTLNQTFLDILLTGVYFLIIALFIFVLITMYSNRCITAKNYLYKYFIAYLNDEIQLRKQINVIEPEKEIIKDYIEEAVQMNRNRKHKKVKR